MTRLQAEGVSFTYPGAASPAVNELYLVAPAGRLTVLFGPSGCGKTTLLRLIAGLERLDSGSLYFDDQPVHHLPVERRGAVMLFQQPLLLPHMNVIDNIAFGLRARGIRRTERRCAAEHMLSLIGLDGFGSRRPATLSGGQAQRVALGRALVTEPRVLLLDEPLSSLDETLRAELRTLILELQRRTGATTVLVTHDLDEALSMADELAVMIDGSIRQCGDPRSVYARPADIECAAILGVVNVLPGLKQGGWFDAAIGRLSCDPACRADGPATAIIRAERIGLTPATDSATTFGTSGDATASATACMGAGRGTSLGTGLAATDQAAAMNELHSDAATTLAGSVMESSFRGADEQVRVRVGFGEIWSAIANWNRPPPSTDERVWISIPKDAVHLVDPPAVVP